jgi:hypothetical protein
MAGSPTGSRFSAGRRPQGGDVTLRVEEKRNFEAMRIACKNGDLALVECTDADTGRRIVAICAVNCERAYELVPIAEMLGRRQRQRIEPPRETGLTKRRRRGKL